MTTLDAPLNWWGFRVRNPKGYDPPPPSRGEALAFGFVLAVLLELAWTLLVVLELVPAGRPDATLEAILGPPLALLLVPPLLFLAGPRALVDQTPAGTVLVLAREKGDVGAWDPRLAGLALLGVVLVLVRHEAFSLAQMVALLSTGSAVLAASLGLLLFQPRVDFSRRRWQFQIPSWLLEEGEREIVEESPGPEAGSNRYTLDLPGAAASEVGIEVPTQLLDLLRALNARHGGTLYLDDAPAVALMDRPPVTDVEEIGTSAARRMDALCRQVAARARQARVSRFQLATAVLHLVQKGIDYEFDHDSTAGLPGGPFKEYGRFPLETLHDGVGDCECTALLCASLLAGLGFEAALVLVTLKEEDGSTSGHAAVGLGPKGLLLSDLGSEGAPGGIEWITDPKDPEGSRWFYGETAIDGATLGFGTIPPEWRNEMRVESVVRVVR